METGLIIVESCRPLRRAGQIVGTEEAATEEGLLKLVPLIERTSQLVELHRCKWFILLE